MTCFAFGAKWARPGNLLMSAACACPPGPSLPSSEAKAAQPTALAPRLRNWRRVSERTYSWNGFMDSTSSRVSGSPTAASFVQDFIQVHQLVRQHGPRGQRGGVERRVGLRFADGQQVRRV